MSARSLTGDVGIEEFLPQFAGMFINRTDDYAVQRENGRYMRVGVPLTWEVVREHVQGKQTVGTYVMNAHGLCRYVVYDADSEDGLDVLLGVQAHLANDGILSYLEASRRGGHLWVLLDGMYRASDVRRWLPPYCPVGVEFYPKQDEGTGYGSLIRLPFGVHRQSGCWYPFLVWDEQQEQVVPVAETMGEMLQWLAVGAKATLPSWVDETVPPPRTTRPQHTPIVSKEAHMHAHTSTLHATIQDWCQAQDPFALIGRYVVLDASGLGHCHSPNTTGMAATGIPRFGSTIHARRPAPAGTATPGATGATSSISCCAIITWTPVLSGIASWPVNSPDSLRSPGA